MKKKIMYMFLTVILVVGGITAYSANAKAQELEKRIETIVTKSKKLYSNTSENFLAENISEKSITAVNELIKAEKGTKLTEELAGKLNSAIMRLNTAEQMLNVRDKVNSLLDEEGVLTVEANVNEAQEALANLSEAKPEFVADLEQAVVAANEQQQLINNTTEQVNNLYDETGALKTDLTLTQISELTALAETIGQEVARTGLLAKTSMAYETVTVWEAEKAEVARLAEEARIAEEARKAEAAKASQGNKNTNNNQASSNNAGNNNSSSSSSNKTNNNSNSKASGNNSSSNNNSNSKSSGGGGSNSSGGSGSGSVWDNFNPGDSWTGTKKGEEPITGNPGGNIGEFGTF